MKKTLAYRRGFTLAEIVCVIAIILVLSSVFVTSVSDYLRSADVAADKVEQHDDMNVRVEDDVQGYLKGYTRDTAPDRTPTGNTNLIPGPAAPGAGGGGAPSVASEPAATTTNPPPQTTTTQETTTETTLPPTTTTQNTSGGGAGNNGGSTGAVRPANGLTTTGQGVVSITPSNGGNTYSVKIQINQYNTLDISIAKRGNGFVLTIGNGTGSGRWMLDQNIFPSLWNTDTYALTAAQISYLQNTFGLAIG
ncbi:MAG: prepilin-type N-terminal cleavage/methylation domain-containing protein [Clostridiales bacterium]|nr:prepilin-type N-terminal cleavage/methylation domain-containing protein [Clostridiales bacterium]